MDVSSKLRVIRQTKDRLFGDSPLQDAEVASILESIFDDWEEMRDTLTFHWKRSPRECVINEIGHLLDRVREEGETLLWGTHAFDFDADQHAQNVRQNLIAHLALEKLLEKLKAVT
jgi:hypothetical protein